MTQSEEDGLREILERMDAPELRETAMELSKKLGIRRSTMIAIGIAEHLEADPWQHVYDRALYELNAAGVLHRSKVPGYERPDAVVRSAVRGAFCSELSFLLATRPDDAPDFVLAIAGAVWDSDSAVFDGEEKLREECVEYMQRCVDGGRCAYALDLRCQAQDSHLAPSGTPSDPSSNGSLRITCGRPSSTTTLESTSYTALRFSSVRTWTGVPTA